MLNYIIAMKPWLSVYIKFSVCLSYDDFLQLDLGRTLELNEK